MKIIVISDTHISSAARGLPSALLKELSGADLILHAGDWTDWSVYEKLSAFAPVEGIAGNNDGPIIVQRLGYERIVEVEGKRIGIVHGDGFRGTTEERAIATFAGRQMDCIIYGHSHIPALSTLDGVMVLNPGSPTDKRRQEQYSFAVLTLKDGRLEARHIFFADKN
ncbi:metallophosphoesterase [Paenibacillus sp. P96]|uniref:Phosphoesterase n=1 Tax=Paenibacillus zeirhizosphaerae TaxID=2987519 RepID=A0ABT9FRQ3_9BACL|nr:metallophosphoesterase [Paenibacillus sp. P96]MDP4097413.1 metallophosphoesterase [Paenibacillus sp. P96]